MLSPLNALSADYSACRRWHAGAIAQRLHHAGILWLGPQHHGHRVAEFLIHVPIEKRRENRDAWGAALKLAIETDADSIFCRPGWLT